MYATYEGKVLKGSEELARCGVRDGSTVQVASRLRGGGRHKDRKSQAEKKQAVNAKKQEQMCAGETKSNTGPLIRECDKDAVQQMVEEVEGYRKVIECVSQGTDFEVE